MKKLGEVQTAARFEARDAALALTSTEGLIVANKILRLLCTPRGYVTLPGRNLKVGRHWPELSYEGTVGNTTAGTDYIAPLPVIRFQENPTYVTLYQGEEEPLPPVGSDEIWSGMVSATQGRPRVYKVVRASGGEMRIYMRPVPDAVYMVRVYGWLEPEPMVNTESVTPWLSAYADDAYAKLIAAEFASQRGFLDRALELRQDAYNLMPRDEVTPVEGTRQITPWQM